MNHKIYCFCCIIGAIILTITVGCGRKSKESKVTSETKSVEIIRPNQYCRAIVNTKDGYSTWVTFEKDNTDVTAVRHWGNVIKVDDKWVQIVKMSYLGKRKDYEMVFLKDLKNGRYNYLSVLRNFMYDAKISLYSEFCFSYNYYFSIGKWEENKFVDLDHFANGKDVVLLQEKYDEMIENELDLTSDELRRKYCKYDASWMIYKNKPKYEFICEAENLSIKIHIRLAKIFAMLTLLGAYPPFSLSISSPD